jgi:hypothetical protein
MAGLPEVPPDGAAERDAFVPPPDVAHEGTTPDGPPGSPEVKSFYGCECGVATARDRAAPGGFLILGLALWLGRPRSRFRKP